VSGVARLLNVGLVGAGHLAECLPGHRRRIVEVQALNWGHPLTPDLVAYRDSYDVNEPAVHGRV
jgi:hypothetical protein